VKWKTNKLGNKMREKNEIPARGMQILTEPGKNCKHQKLERTIETAGAESVDFLHEVRSIGPVAEKR